MCLISQFTNSLNIPLNYLGHYANWEGILKKIQEIDKKLYVREDKVVNWVGIFNLLFEWDQS